MPWRFFDGVEVFALNVFDQRGLLTLDIIPLAHDGGNRRKIGQSGGAPAAFARDDGIAPIVPRDENRRDHAVMADGLGQREQRVVVKLFARLITVRVDIPDGDFRHSVGRHGRRALAHLIDGLHHFFHIRQDGAQSPAQSHFLRHDGSCLSASFGKEYDRVSAPDPAGNLRFPDFPYTMDR